MKKFWIISTVLWLFVASGVYIVQSPVEQPILRPIQQRLLKLLIPREQYPMCGRDVKCGGPGPTPF
jgi:hypothetical protein